jgi:GDP-4-dehydro-6-deoxy-D-mannose reductase
VKALVTGARGFVGPHLVDHLREQGDDVVIVDRSGPGGVDVTDGPAVRDAFDRAGPEVVYHLAALSHVGESWAAPEVAFRVNAEGTLHVLRAALDAGAGRVVVVGSAEEYGRVDPDDLPLREDAPLRPVTPYGAAKVAAEYLAVQAHLGEGLATVRVRAFGHTGAGQSTRFLVPALARRVAEAEVSGTDEIVVGNLDPVRDLSDVRDVVRAYRLLAEHGEAGEVYNVCSGTGIRVADVADVLLGLATRPLRLRVDEALVRPVDTPRLVGDPTRLRAATGWEPRYTLEETLAAVLDSARAAVAAGG